MKQPENLLDLDESPNIPTILCVDDEKIVLDSLKQQLKSHFGKNCRIELAESGPEAIELTEEIFEEFGFAPSVIICDQIMPQMKGDTVLHEIKKKFPKTLCILLTGQADMNDLISVINNVGLYRYIAKPWGKQDLNLTVKEALIAHQKEKELGIRNNQLIELNKTLESKVEQRSFELRERKEELEQVNREISQSINYARNIQSTLLPDLDELKDYFKGNMFALYRPKDIVSGDVYWAYEEEEFLYLAVIDCTGHGVPGGFLSMMAIEMLSCIVRRDKLVSYPGEILNQLHFRMVDTLKQDKNNTHNGMDISLCRMNRADETMEFALANHKLITVTGEDHKEFRGQNIGVGGLVEFPRMFTTTKLKIQKDTNYYLSTDGYADQFGGPRNKKMMRGNFLKLLRELNEVPITDQKKKLEDHLDNWQGDNFQVDDITVLGFNFGKNE